MKWLEKYEKAQNGKITPKELSGPTIRGKKYPINTIVTNDRNDPRLRSYQDSLRRYNASQQMLKGILSTNKPLQDSANVAHRLNLEGSIRAHMLHNNQAEADKTNALLHDSYRIDRYEAATSKRLDVYDKMNKYLDKNHKPTVPVIIPVVEVGVGGNSVTNMEEYLTFKKPTQPIVFQDSRITPMKSLNMSNPKITPNSKIQPDVIRLDSMQHAAYIGVDITHQTDEQGRWVAKMNKVTTPGVRGSLSTPNPEGNYTIKYQDGGEVVKETPEAVYRKDLLTPKEYKDWYEKSSGRLAPITKGAKKHTLQTIGEETFPSTQYSSKKRIEHSILEAGGAIHNLQTIDEDMPPNEEWMQKYQREYNVGMNVEKEHKPTLEFIKKYHKEHNKFPSLKTVAASIATDHIRDFKKVPDPQAPSYYQGLINNNLSDEVFQYENGGELNYNDSTISIPEGFVGMGNNTTGRNYSPAWNGQFQYGGDLSKYIPQDKFLQPNSIKLPWGYKFPNNYPNSELATSIGGEDGEPAYLIPSFKYGHPLDNPIEEYRNTGEYLGGPFKTYQEADDWDMNVRHPYVEKKQSIPSPIKTWGEMRSGGEIMNVASEQFPIAKNGIIQDDNGYWNPDNWGKPVEINSNDITMRGVNQPLMGISDTGDVQMMQPNQDYHFKGSRVTELPMARNGEPVTKAPVDDLNDYIKAYNTSMRKVHDSVIQEEAVSGEAYAYADKMGIDLFTSPPTKLSDIDIQLPAGSIKEANEHLTPYMNRVALTNKYLKEQGAIEDQMFNTPQGKKLSAIYNRLSEVSKHTNTVIEDKSKFISIGDDVKYPVAGYMRNAKFTENAINDVKKFAKKRNVDPAILAAALTIEGGGEVKTSRYFNTHNVITKELERMGLPPQHTFSPYNTPSDASEDYIQHAKQAGAYMKDGSINVKKLDKYLSDKLKQMNNFNPDIENAIDEMAYYISRNGLGAVNPAQKTLPGVKNDYVTMINSGADVIRKKKIFRDGGVVGISQQNDRDGSQLEQLQNFTNYNKKAKNGKWLEKHS